MKYITATLVFLFIIVGAAIFTHKTVAAQGACKTDYVIYCGLSSTNQLVSDYLHGDGHFSAASIQNIYGAFNINASDISTMPKDAVNGVVTKSGEVLVNGKVVAKDAYTAGREYIPGSIKRDFNGTTYYTRTPSVSFLQNQLSAYVVMSNGKFQYAILVSCGNPIEAHPVVPPPAPAVKPAPTPTGKCLSLSATKTSSALAVKTKVYYEVSGGAALQSVHYSWGDSATTVTTNVTALHVYKNYGTYNIKAVLYFTPQGKVQPSTCTASITYQKPAPPPSKPAPQQLTPQKPQATPPSAPTKPLVNTGPGDVLGIFFGAVAAGYLAFRFYLRKKLAR